MIRWLGPAGFYLALTLAAVLPLLPVFGSAVPHDAGDPLLNTWILWWSTRAVPLTAGWWNAPMFFPMAEAMALSELLLGLVPVTGPIQWLTGNPIAAYNTAFVLSFPLSAGAAAALAYEVTRRRDASLIAGVAFAFAPYRMGQLAHLQMLAYYFAPIALLALHRYVRTERPVWLVVFAAAWLLQGLSNGYALFHFSVFVVLWVLWFARSFRLVAAIAVAWMCAAVPMVPLLLTYREVHANLHLVRDINEVERFGADLAGFAAAPGELLLWGGRLAEALPETALFPGVTVLFVVAAAGYAAARGRTPASTGWTWPSRLTAAVALAAALVAFSPLVIGPWSMGRLVRVSEFHKPFSIAVLAALATAVQRPALRRVWREHSVIGFYVIAAIAMYVLALGPSPTFRGEPLLYEPPYAWLMRLPGFATLRVPARFAMLAVLAQSIALAIAVARAAAGRRRALVTALVCAGLLADGWVHLPVAAATTTRLPRWRDIDAVVELPFGRPDLDVRALVRSMQHGHPVVNGYSGYEPPHYLPLVHAIRDGALDALAELAVYGRIGVAVDRYSADGAAIAAAVQARAGTTRGPHSHDWALFRIAPVSATVAPTGEPLPVRSVHANVQEQDLHRLTDGTVATAWGSGSEQRGGEAVVVDLGSEQTIGAIILEMGAYAFGHPRALLIERSSDGEVWSDVWRGATAVQTVRAALANPGRVPVTIGAETRARFVRLTQIGTEPGIPWWIGELQVRAPAR